MVAHVVSLMAFQSPKILSALTISAMRMTVFLYGYLYICQPGSGNHVDGLDASKEGPA
jgi:hypothetical protein